jgi:hypothetical protein
MNSDENPAFRLSTRPLIAPVWHTIVFIAMFVGLSVVGGFFQHSVERHPQTTVPSGSPVPGYLSVLVFEWLLVLYVRMGVHQRDAGSGAKVGGLPHGGGPRTADFSGDGDQQHRCVERGGEQGGFLRRVACQVLPLTRLGEGAQAPDAPADKFRDWQESTNSIFCARPLAGLRQQMEVWFYPK